ncbi:MULTISPECIES: MDR family MFS transporter [Olivibacter]|uniref:MDR family MFS transporter n=1 Tax=Olivibacter oleidegradans TaxID=760123 RepID=A0ABV6HKJ9_9SPHI|nr:MULTISPECIES: MDR family MFS transporter [Olivibacter]MDX3914042.1 MDR family MFS transporter [Pseudosphingobacterium sp.]QEL02187.1 multidrug efflux MFS transporter [Olivibacter sp. LS-1]
MLINRSFVLATLMMATSMAAIDSSIVNVSLPVMRNDFGVDLNQIEWVITAYMISFSLFIPLTNWLKKRFGYYYLFLGSIVIFTLGSLLCSLSVSLDMLVISRIIQAIGGGSLSPTSLAILSETFPKEERGTAIGWWGMGNVMGPALGPTLGGVLTHYLGWESIFYINIPIGALTIFFSIRYLSFLKRQVDKESRFDVRGFIFFSIFIIILQYTISTISKQGFLSVSFFVGLLITLLMLYFFVQSAKKPQSLLDLNVFRIRQFNVAATITIIRSLALYGGMFFLPFLLQGLLGYTEIESGLLMLPNALIMLVSRPLSGRLADKGMIRNISISGILIVSISFFMLARIDIGVSVWFILFTMAIRGLGMSLLVAPVSTALLNAVKPNQTQTATALNSLFLQVGGSIGIAVSAVIHTFIYDRYLENQYPDQVAEHFALQNSFLITAVIILLAVLPALKLPQKSSLIYMLRNRNRDKKGDISAEEKANLLNKK